MIVNTSGWDTDCNSGNVGCLLGIKNGLAAIDGGYDWRGPVADRMYLSTADGGRAITDAVSRDVPDRQHRPRPRRRSRLSRPKDGARFHFELPGASRVLNSIATGPRARLTTSPVTAATAGAALPSRTILRAAETAFASRRRPSFHPKR